MSEKNKTILIAEDEADIREMYFMALSGAGYNVLQAKNGKEVFEWLDKKADEIKLILLDVVMPEMDGFEVLEKMNKKEEYKNIPIIVATNLDNDEDKKNASALGANGYFVKSNHTPSELAENVSRVLAEEGKV